MKASYSFVLAVLSCATTVLSANSPAGNTLRTAAPSTYATSQTDSSSPRSAFRSPSGWGSYAPPVKSPVHLCFSCALIAGGLNIASNAVEITGIQALTGWSGTGDSAGTGSANGTTGLVSNPALSGTARQFKTSFTNGGSERFSTSFGADEQATHFIYDGWVYISAPSLDVANIEMDMNQVMANGQTVIYGVQCDGYSNTWDYTANHGTPQNPNDVWVHSSAPCNPRNWATNTWHHVQISYSRDNSGNVTYGSVWLDGVQQNLNATVPSAFALGWGSVLLTNFQVDGLGASGSTNVYLDNLVVYRW
ncbi:MAG TPA: hypothetical protein VHZ28_00055 [Terracidiphilus sp.]|nr:hypothetical protein [Terracidiphilus sp.]